MARAGDPLSAGRPAQVGRYRVLAPIAGGGMAMVYLAEQTGLGGFGRQVALKLVHAHLRQDPQWATALVEEAKLAARVQHPNVVQTLDVGEAPEGVFLVMEYVEGDTLAALIRHAAQDGGVVPLPIALRVLTDVLSGLHAAHEMTDDDGRPVRLVHRDFSPQNVIVGIDGIARLADFGIAKADGSGSVTSTGVLKGKVAFMPPEQVRGVPLDRRCDIWAAGIVAWELAVGRRLYSGLEDATILLSILAAAPPAPSAWRPELHPALDAAIGSALHLDRDERVPTALAFRERLLDAAAAAGEALATHEEVGQFVQRSAGERLEALRRAARESKDASREGRYLSGQRRFADVEPTDAATQTTLVSDTGKKIRPLRARMMPLALVGLSSATMALVAGLRLGAARRPAPDLANLAGPEASASSEVATAALVAPSSSETRRGAGAATATETGPPPAASASSSASSAPAPTAQRIVAPARGRHPPSAPVASTRKLLGNPY